VLPQAAPRPNIRLQFPRSGPRHEPEVRCRSRRVQRQSGNHKNGKHGEGTDDRENRQRPVCETLTPGSRRKWNFEYLKPCFLVASCDPECPAKPVRKSDRNRRRDPPLSR